MDTTNLKVYLPFDDSTTQDLCGGSWTATGNPTIQDGKLYLNGESYLQLDGGVTLGGQDFTICCKAKMDSNGWYDGLFSANNKQIRICGVERYTDRLLIAIKNNEKTVTGLDLTFPFHVEIDYQHSTGIWRVFFNGNLIRSYTSSRSRTTYSTFLIGSNGDPDPNAKYWHGSIDEFQIYDGVALHTENFTPPTADEYTALKLALGGSAPVVLNCDVERKVAAPVQVNFDVQRVLWQKWFYYNAGSADTLTISGTTLINLPATKSKTGSAFYQTARQKCFDLPATDEIWIKFDVYFDGSNRWRAYNGGSNGTTGITAQTNLDFDFWVNGSNVFSRDNACKKNQLQTVLLHMVSGSSAGVVEAWLDGEKIHTFTGDVNHGQDFNDIYLQSDGSGTFFSNVIISNVEISLDAGFCSLTLDVERRISKAFEITFDVERNFISPIIVPFIGEHFCHFVHRVKIFGTGAQKIILPKKSEVYIRAKGAGVFNIFSDTNTNGIIRGDDFHQSSDLVCWLDECNSVFIKIAQKVTALQVIKDFMQSLDKTNLSGTAALDEAINFATGGLFSTNAALINQFMADLNSTASDTAFLQTFCDIVLSNEDTGAITGFDAGGLSYKTKKSIVPENTPIASWQTPDVGSTVEIEGLYVTFPATGADGKLTRAENFILAGLNSEWIAQSLKLIKKSFGIDFHATSATVHQIYVKFERSYGNSSFAYVSHSDSEGKATSLTLVINMNYFAYIDLNKEDGEIPSSSLYLDRTLAHEFTHAVMAANINNFSSLPKYIKEGTAELVHGIDDVRRNVISALITSRKADLQTIFSGGETSNSQDPYVAGFLLLRYLAKQGQSRDNFPFPTRIDVTELIISDGGFDSDYEALSDYTRQIFSADVSRVLARSLALNCDVELLSVVRVDFLLDVKRSLLANLILFPRSSDDFFADDNNPFVVRQSNSLLAKSRKLRSATPANTDGLQNFELQIAEQQITDQVRFSAVIPFDIMQQVSGQYLDYHYNMRVERVQQQGILYSCDCCSDVDQLLYTQIAYKIPPITTWWKIEGEEVGGTPKTVEFQTIYPSAAEHANKIAAALGLSPVIQFDHFLSTVLMDDKGGVTYNDLIRDIFGWSSRVPTMLINIFIRDGKLYFIQRGHEAHTVDISNAQMTVPVITKEIVRTSWGSSVESRTNVSEFDAKIMTFTPDTIVGGDSSGGDEERYVTISDRSSGLNWTATTTYNYSRKYCQAAGGGLMPAGLLLQVTVDKNYNDGSEADSFTQITHDYDKDGTRVGTETYVHYSGIENPPPDTRNVNQLSYVTLPNGEKYLASESNATYEDDKLVDVTITTHSPSRLGQTHVTAIGNSDIKGEATGQNTGDDRITPYRLKQSADLATTFNSAGGTWEENTTHYEHGMTVYGLSLFDSSFPIHDQATLIKVTNALKNLNRKTKETVNVSIYDFEHIIDFNDKIRLNGAQYFLAANTARTTPRIKFEQNLTLVRWY